MNQVQQLELSNLPPRPSSLRVLRETAVNRLYQSGQKALSLLELVSVLVHDPDVALRVLTQYPDEFELARAPMADLEAIPGMGPARVAALQAALELGQRVSIGNSPEPRQIRCPADAAKLVMDEMSKLEQEEMRVFLLDARNYLIGTPLTVYRGNLSMVVVRPGELFREAIRRNASSVIVCHNHPTGVPDPSPDDVSTSRAIVQAGKVIDIEVMDHLIIGRGRFVSLKERGLGFD